MQGALLSPEGWKKATPLFERAIQYPDNSKITIMWTPRVIGEDWIKGNRAQVESKWIDYYGTIDGKLQYQRPETCDVAVVRLYDLIASNAESKTGGAKKASNVVGWKLAWQMERAATIEQVIDYLTQRRETIRDPVIKRNASRSIVSLQKLLKSVKRGRGASAC